MEIKAEGGRRKAEGAGLRRGANWFCFRLSPFAFPLALPAFLLSSTAVAQEFPARPVRMVIPIGPGSSMDITGRVVAQRMNEVWGQPVVVDNRPGAGGNIGDDVVAKSPSTGYTGLFCSSSLAIARSAYRRLPYDALRDLEPVTQISSRGDDRA